MEKVGDFGNHASDQFNPTLGLDRSRLIPVQTKIPKMVDAEQIQSLMAQTKPKSPMIEKMEPAWLNSWQFENREIGPAGFEPATKGLCVPLRLSPTLSSSWSGPYLHFTCLPSGLYTFCPQAAWFGISVSTARFSLPRI